MPVGGSQIQKCFPVCRMQDEQDEVGDVSSVSVHYITELSDMSVSLKRSNSSVYGTVKGCRRLNLD